MTRYSQFAWLAVPLLLAGCQPAQPSKPTAPPSSPASPTDVGKPLTVPNPVAQVTPTPSAATPPENTAGAVADFLKLAASNAKAAAGQLDPAFRQLFFTEDKLIGWLTEQTAGLTNYAGTTAATADNRSAVRGTAQRNGQPVTVSAWLTKEPNGWQVRRLLVTDAALHSASGPATMPAEAARDFLAALATAAPQHDYAFALASMTEAGKNRLGPSDNARRQLLRGRGTVKSFSLSPIEVTAQSATYSGQLVRIDRPAVNYALRLVPAPDGRWLVDEFSLAE